MVTNELEDGDRQKAMKRLRVPPLGAAQVMEIEEVLHYISLDKWTSFKSWHQVHILNYLLLFSL